MLQAINPYRVLAQVSPHPEVLHRRKCLTDLSMFLPAASFIMPQAILSNQTWRTLQSFEECYHAQQALQIQRVREEELWDTIEQLAVQILAANSQDRRVQATLAVGRHNVAREHPRETQVDYCWLIIQVGGCTFTTDWSCDIRW